MFIIEMTQIQYIKDFFGNCPTKLALPRLILDTLHFVLFDAHRVLGIESLLVFGITQPLCIP